jgi:hypothetical protein
MISGNAWWIIQIKLSVVGMRLDSASVISASILIMGLLKGGVNVTPANGAI